ncbi:MAG: hypothetical protein IPM56_03540 [Ignavibacteriales bacterium]|nr:MAG: hypothetical protein IPM56_03540 [Ignavibacteriales bacterium]
MTKHSDSSKHLQLVPHKNSSHLFDIKLQLEFQTRFIGKLDITDNGTLILNRRKEHILNKINAFGINYELLSDERIKFKWIKIFCEKDIYISTREYFLIKGKTFQFGNKGYELQNFVPLSELNILTIKKFEIAKNKQGYLFEEVS